MISCARRNTVLGVVVAGILAGCAEPEPQEETRTVEWFIENPTDRAEMLKRCDNNPGELRETPNCQNAVRAEEKASSGSLRTLNNW